MKKKNGAFVTIFKNKKRDQIFLVFRSDYPIWVQPGGGIEPGETPKKAAIRETLEETGFKIRITRKIGVYEYVKPKTGEKINLTHLYDGEILSGTFSPEFSGCKGLWFYIKNLPKDITDKTRQRIMDAADSDGKEFYKKVYPIRLVDNLHLLFRHPLAALRYLANKTIMINSSS